MSADLRDALDRLASEGTDGIDLPTLARGAVRRRRRRQARRLVVLGSGVALIALLAVTVTPGWSQLQRDLLPASGATRVGGHPRSIGWQWPVRDLPARPGPMAGLLKEVGSGWWVVRADGHRYRLRGSEFDDSHPALSADGRRLAYVAPDGDHFVVQDLVSGRRTVLDRIGDSHMPGPFDHGSIGLLTQSPIFWSPRGDVLASIGFVGKRSGVVLIDARAGMARLVEAAGQLAGWLPDDRTYVTVEGLTKKLPNPNPEIVTGTTVISGFRVHLVRVSGGGRVVDLRPRRDWSLGAEFSQWSWAVSPDGRTLLAVSGRFGPYDALTLRRFRLSDGHEIGVERVVTDGHFPCSVGWVDASTVSVPIVDSRQRAGRVLVDLRTGGSRTATVVSSHVDKDGGCLEESSLALAGPAVSGGLLGLSGVTWALWLLAVFAAATFLVVRRRRRA